MTPENIMNRTVAESELEHHGICDASAAIALNKDSFVIASDEDNLLRLYRSNESGGALAIVNIGDQLSLKDSEEETDIEGASMLKDTIFWITSHGRTAKGKKKKARFRFFANQIKIEGHNFTCKPVGKAYKRLLKDILEDDRYKRYDLDKAAKLPPKQKGGLNIEGLAATPNESLLIGFRNPIPDGKALLIPISNPFEVIEGQTALFGDPIELNLAGLGIRSIEFWHEINSYLIIAGPYYSDGPFKLFLWENVHTNDVSELAADLSDLNAEAIVIYPDESKRFQIISDDGAIEREGSRCKDLPPNSTKMYFKSKWYKLI